MRDSPTPMPAQSLRESSTRSLIAVPNVAGAMPTMVMPGICEKKAQFISKLQRRYGGARSATAACDCAASTADAVVLTFAGSFWARLPIPPKPGASIEDVSSWLTGVGLHLNKGELENLFLHYKANAEGTAVDLQTFIGECSVVTSGTDPVWLPHEGESPYAAHLALSGVSHLEFGIQAKPFPKHWGAPPNAQMKGHSGVMRDLPGGYGKGNEPMFKWVKENMTKDKDTKTNERGVKPFPLGNYSLGNTGVSL